MGVNRSPIVIDLRFGIVASWAGWESKGISEQGFQRLRYCPLNTMPPKIFTLETPIHRDDIQQVYPTETTIPGVEREIIYTNFNDDNPLIKKIMGDKLQKIKDLSVENKSLKQKVASLEQDLQDARSGVNKSLAAMKDVQKSSRPSSPFGDNGYSSPFPSRGDGFGGDGFNSD